MRGSIGSLLCAVAVSLAPGLAAQRPAGTAALEGVVLDSASRTPSPRMRVCARLPTRLGSFNSCAEADPATGSYKLDSLPVGRWMFDVTCGMVSIFGGRIADDSISVLADTATRRDWVVSTIGCDPRPLRRIERVFRGHYTFGFETSDFIPCHSDAWTQRGDSLRRYEQGAWVELSRGATPDGFAWPRVTTRRDGTRRYYVEWRGTVVGPGHYGHMSVSPFLIRVDSVIMVRRPAGGDCRVSTWSPLDARRPSNVRAERGPLVPGDAIEERPPRSLDRARTLR
jgi:hypothetical protein